MKTVAIVIAILVGAGGIMVAVTTKQTGFDHCVSIISRDVEAQAAATAASIDPRDVEIQAAKVCAGAPA